jgi:predicted DNA binding CopG/RHH family protein
MRLVLATITTLLLSVSNFAAQAACLDNDALQKLSNNEVEYMLARIPPAFSDAVTDKKIEFKMHVADASTCQVNFEVTLPENDVKEANLLLEADPAKKIILFSQGYVLPETTTLNAAFTVDPLSLQASHADILQSGELGKLRASIEMMYAMLTQQRADIDEKMQNTQPWSTEFRQQQFAKCTKQFESTQQEVTGCECQISKISEIASERQIRYVEYVDSNPYAQATGASKNFASVKSQIQLGCGLKKTGS